MSNYKERITKSIEKFSLKNDGISKRRKKTNNDVEGPVVLAIKNHFNALGWHLQRIESKAVFNESAGRYIGSQADPGTSDLVGNTPDGIACFIEVKAKGKRSTLRPEQREFLIAKIATNCFAICADSIEYVDKVYSEWRKSDNRKSYLLKELPAIAPRYKEEDFSID